MELQEYELNDDVTIEKLKEIGFKEIISGNRKTLSYFRVLNEEIELYINFDITKSDEITFDENKNVEVIDDMIGQYFTAFYNNVNNKYVKKCKQRYHEEMMNLVNKGILKIRSKEKQLIKIK